MTVLLASPGLTTSARHLFLRLLSGFVGSAAALAASEGRPVETRSRPSACAHRALRRPLASARRRSSLISFLFLLSSFSHPFPPFTLVPLPFTLPFSLSSKWPGRPRSTPNQARNKVTRRSADFSEAEEAGRGGGGGGTGGGAGGSRNARATIICNFQVSYHLEERRTLALASVPPTTRSRESEREREREREKHLSRFFIGTISQSSAKSCASPWRDKFAVRRSENAACKKPLSDVRKRKRAPLFLTSCNLRGGGECPGGAGHLTREFRGPIFPSKSSVLNEENGDKPATGRSNLSLSLSLSLSVCCAMHLARGKR